MGSNFKFLGIRNNSLEFQETSNKMIFNLPCVFGCKETDVYLREGDLVVAPNGNGGYFDVWNIREHRIVKSNIKPEDPNTGD